MKREEKKIEEIIRLLSANKQINKQIFTLPEAAQFMSMSKSQLYKLTSSRQIEYYCPRGKQIYFTRESLERHMLQNRVPTREEISQNVHTALAKRKNK
jgi:excisionase family DNA binding protein